MATPKVTPATPRGLVAVTGGSGYIAGYCIAQLLNQGWRARTTVRNLDRAEEVRTTMGKITANASAIEFRAANLNSDVGWADAVAGAEYVLHVASPVPKVDPKSDDELVRPARDGTCDHDNVRSGATQPPRRHRRGLICLSESSGRGWRVCPGPTFLAAPRMSDRTHGHKRQGGPAGGVAEGPGSLPATCKIAFSELCGSLWITCRSTDAI